MTALLKRLLAIMFYWRRREEPSASRESTNGAQDQEVDSARHNGAQTRQLTPVIVPPGAILVTKGQDVSFDGRFYFKDDVLDQLDYYFASIQRFKRARDDFYDLISQIGVNLAPDRMYGDPSDVDDDFKYPDTVKVEPWFAQKLPGFGAVAMGTLKKLRAYETGKDVIHPRFFYFTRYHRRGEPITIQPSTGGAIYVVGMFYDQTGVKRPGRKERRGSRAIGVVEMPVLVMPDGLVVALKSRNVHPLHFPRKNHRRGADPYYNLASRSEWGFPSILKEWATEHKTTVEKYMCYRFFATACNHTRLNSSMIRVSVKKDGLAAVMNVDMERTPYFFKDRDAVIVDGIKKRIFHIVRPHERLIGEDKTTDVHMHFRGLREFNWNGYSVAITVPGRDHADWAQADFAAYDVDSEKGRKLKRFVNMRHLGEKAAKNMQPPRPQA